MQGKQRGRILRRKLGGKAQPNNLLLENPLTLLSRFNGKILYDVRVFSPRASRSISLKVVLVVVVLVLVVVVTNYKNFKIHVVKQMKDGAISY